MSPKFVVVWKLDISYAAAGQRIEAYIVKCGCVCAILVLEEVACNSGVVYIAGGRQGCETGLSRYQHRFLHYVCDTTKTTSDGGRKLRFCYLTFCIS